MENGNIKVVVRLKPLPESETESSIIERATNDTIFLKDSNQNLVNNKFTFDKILTNSTQKQVFECVGDELVETVFEGIHATAIMYGQTASGKTYTCMGPSLKDEDKKGLIPRIVQRMFQRIEECSENIQFRLKISLVEIYMQKIKDLLDVSKDNLKVRESSARGVYIQNVTEIYVGSKEEVYHSIQFANNNRSLAHTNMNEASSRSHLVFVMTVYQNNLEDLSAKSAKLTLVDLAGSQKISKTGAEGKVLDEAKQINKSLLALGNVINSLIEDKVKHIPYRDSKLTRILQQSLGGNAITNIIINISSHIYNQSQTISTLRFALRAKKIKNKPTVNRQFSVAQLMALLQKAEIKIKQQERYIKQLKKNPNTSERYSVMSVLSSLSEFDKIGQREEQIPEEYIEKEWQKQLETAQKQIETLQDDHLGLESLTNVLKKQIQTLKQRNRQLELENQTLKQFGNFPENGQIGNRSSGIDESKIRRATKKVSLFGSQLLGLKGKELLQILPESSEIRKKQKVPTFQEKQAIEQEAQKLREQELSISHNDSVGSQDLQQLLKKYTQQNKYLRETINLDQNFQIRKILKLEQMVDDLMSKYYTIKGNESKLRADVKILESKLSRKGQRITELQTTVMVSKESIQIFKKKHGELETSLRSKKSSFINSNSIRRPFTSVRSSARQSKIVKVLMPSNFKIPDIEEENSESDQS